MRPTKGNARSSKGWWVSVFGGNFTTCRGNSKLLVFALLSERLLDYKRPGGNAGNTAYCWNGGCVFFQPGRTDHRVACGPSWEQYFSGILNGELESWCCEIRSGF